MKTVIIVDKHLPLGLITNTAAVLGLSLGSTIDGLVGSDIKDMDGKIHMGITNIPIPILGGSREQIKNIRDYLFTEEFSNVTVIDFNTVAQKSKNYEEYSKALSKTKCKEIQYLGICLYGPTKTINKLTGNIGLLK